VTPAGRQLAARLQQRLDDGDGLLPATPPRAAGWALRNNTTTHAAIRDLDDPAPTMFFSRRVNVVAWTGPHGAVRVTIGEAACFQGFPPRHPWRGTTSQQLTQVGDAVPPPLAAAILAAACYRPAAVP